MHIYACTCNIYLHVIFNILHIEIHVRTQLKTQFYDANNRNDYETGLKRC